MLATGYIALAAVCITLIIGTFKLLQQRKNPVNLFIRRDIGIWAGITGIVHLVLGFGVYAGDAILPYYVRWTADGAVRPLTTLFGFNNYTGTAAALILVVLLLTSNQLSLIWLKGKRWKALQRWNYGLAVLAFAHTLGYQQQTARADGFVQATVLLLLLALIVQGTGYFMMLRRQLPPRQRGLTVPE